MWCVEGQLSPAQLCNGCSAMRRKVSPHPPEVPRRGVLPFRSVDVSRAQRVMTLQHPVGRSVQWWLFAFLSRLPVRSENFVDASRSSLRAVICCGARRWQWWCANSRRHSVPLTNYVTNYVTNYDQLGAWKQTEFTSVTVQGKAQAQGTVGTPRGSGGGPPWPVAA